MSVSVFIQTLNEEVNLENCLKSVNFSDDIVVLDSFSTDQTEEISKKYNCRFIQREYDGRANNQNWAVKNIKFKYKWVWYVDADEITTTELRDEILDIVKSDTKKVLYRVRFKNMLMGKWLKNSSLYPTWISRLFIPEKIRWERPANPIAIIDGEEGQLKNHILHYSFNKGFNAWFEKHNKYSYFEAQETIKELKKDFNFFELFQKSAANGRQALKKLSFRFRLRAPLKFIYMYFFKLGFLDGYPGFTYCILTSIYEYMIVLKVREMKMKENGKKI